MTTRRIGLLFVEDDWSDPNYINKTIHRDIKVLDTTNIDPVNNIIAKFGNTLFCFDCYLHGEIDSPQRVQFFDKDINQINDEYNLCRNFFEYICDELDQNSEQYDDSSDVSNSNDDEMDDLDRIQSWNIINNSNNSSEENRQFGGVQISEESSSYLNVDEYTIEVDNTYEYATHCLIGVEDKIKDHNCDLMLVITTYFD
jgi:hypothetical protein